MEIWKKCETYSDYMASTLGRVMSCDRWLINKNGKPYRKKAKILKPMIINKYFRVIVYVEHAPVSVAIHRVVCDAFIGPIPCGLEVNHKDMDRFNNRPENLEYVSHSFNNLHRFIGKKRGVKICGKKFHATFWNGETKDLVWIGAFDHENDAYDAYKRKYYSVHGFNPW